MINVIRIEEGGVSTPHVVHQRFSEFAKIKPGPGMRLIREQRGSEAFLLLCEPIADAVWSDIPSDGETKGQIDAHKGSHVDRKA